jgi:hypothetical protein
MPDESAYFEPWSFSARSQPSPDPFASGVPEGADMDAVAQQRAAAERLNQKKEWIVWGSRVHQETRAKGFMIGDTVSMSDIGIILRTTNHEQSREIAARVVECVNALQGIADPAAFVEAANQALDGEAGHNGGKKARNQPR